VPTIWSSGERPRARRPSQPRPRQHRETERSRTEGMAPGRLGRTGPTAVSAFGSRRSAVAKSGRWRVTESAVGGSRNPRWSVGCRLGGRSGGGRAVAPARLSNATIARPRHSGSRRVDHAMMLIATARGGVDSTPTMPAAMRVATPIRTAPEKPAHEPETWSRSDVTGRGAWSRMVARRRPE